MNNSERVYLLHLNSQSGFVRWVSFWASFWLAKLQHQHFNGWIIKITYRYSAPLKGATFFEALLWEDIIRDYKTPGFSNIKKWSCCNMCMYGMDFLISTWGSFYILNATNAASHWNHWTLYIFWTFFVATNTNMIIGKGRFGKYPTYMFYEWFSCSKRMKVKMPRQLVQWFL